MRNLYPHRNAKRDSLCELRWRHLDQVDSAARSNESVDDIVRSLRAGFEHFFPPIRKRKRDWVPSDELRKDIMVHNLGRLIAERREELAAMPQPSAEELEAALAAAPNEYVRAYIEAYPESVAGRK